VLGKPREDFEEEGGIYFLEATPKINAADHYARGVEDSLGANTWGFHHHRHK
jgi:hypothetical protein